MESESEQKLDLLVWTDMFQCYFGHGGLLPLFLSLLPFLSLSIFV